MSNLRKALNKNYNLNKSLDVKRKTFAEIGTNKSKRRLNKLKEYPICQAVRLALEIEDNNIRAKKYYGDYKEKYYKNKDNLIKKLCELFEYNNWEYGIIKKSDYFTSHIIFFEIPNCEQISWHINLDHTEIYPTYNKEWDNKENSTLDKLETITKVLLKKYNLN